MQEKFKEKRERRERMSQRGRAQNLMPCNWGLKTQKRRETRNICNLQQQKSVLGFLWRVIARAAEYLLAQCVDPLTYLPTAGIKRNCLGEAYSGYNAASCGCWYRCRCCTCICICWTRTDGGGGAFRFGWDCSLSSFTLALDLRHDAPLPWPVLQERASMRASMRESENKKESATERKREKERERERDNKRDRGEESARTQAREGGREGQEEGGGGEKE